MPTNNILARNMFTLPHTVSDLLVALNCLDTSEVLNEARILKSLADEYDFLQLQETTLKIERAAYLSDLDTVRLLLPELHQNLRQAQILIQEVHIRGSCPDP